MFPVQHGEVIFVAHHTGALEEPSWHVARYMADAFGSITLLSPHALRSATDVLRRSDV
jgi:hypothetical protein